MKNKQGMAGVFFSLKGNARACIWTEPLWGIPYNLYVPFASLYMEALGLSRAEIGYTVSISLFVQVVSAVLSGVLADKMGRRRCTVVFDILSWSIPTLLWTLSRGYLWFVAAALFNGLWRITMNSWGLLLVEGNEPDLVVRCFSLTQLLGLLAAFLAPLSKFAVDRYGLVPTMRVLYLIAFVLMTAKFIILYFWSRETEMGLRRMEETRNERPLRMIFGCWGVFTQLIRRRVMVLTLLLCSAFQTLSTLNGSFWALLITERLRVSTGNVVLFTTFKSLVTLLCIFLIVPRLRFARFKRPMLNCTFFYIASQALLLSAPTNAAGLVMLLASVALEAVALSVLTPMTDSLLFVNAEPVERARILGLMYGAMLIPVSIFPAVAGRLAQRSISAPFYINILLCAAILFLIAALDRAKTREDGAA